MYLRGTPGILVTRTGEGRSAHIKLRGASSAQGMVTLDGVPLLTSFPGLNWLDSLPAEALGAAQVIPGSDHAFHTAQSLGGAIRLGSKQAEQSYALGAVEGGSFGQLRETLSGGLKSDWGNLSITGSRIDQFDGGYDAIPELGNPERDPIRSTLGMGSYRLKAGDTAALQGSFLYKDSLLNADLPGISGTGTPSFVDDPDTWFHERLLLDQNTISARLTEAWTSQLQLALTHTEVDAQAGPIPVRFRSDLMFADWRNTHDLWRSPRQNWYMIWGGQGRYEHADHPRNFLEPFLRADRSTVSGFAELQADMGSWHHEAGVRVEDYSDYGIHTLLHFGSRWSLSPSLQFRANAGTSYRAPSYGELYMPLLGNSMLKPEHGLSADVGMDWKPSKAFRLSVTGYYGRYGNLTVSMVEPLRFYTFGNARRSRIAGAEVSTELGWSDSWRNGVGFTYQYTENLDNHEPLPVHPEFTGRAWLQWTPSLLPVTVRFNATYRSAQWHDLAATLHNGDAVRLDIVADYRVSRHLDLYIRGENLNDCKTGDFFARFTPGPTVYGGLHLNF